MIETISRGPQFKGILSWIGLIIFPFALIIGVALCILTSVLAGIIVFLIAVAAFFLFLDVRGVQFDYDNKLVRRYKQYLSWRWGEWIPLDDFGAVHIVKDTFHVGRTTDRYGRRVGGSTISTFDVVLVSKAVDASGILLSEFEKQAEAIEFMKKYATKLQLPSRNIYAELQQSAVSRRQGRR